MDVIDQVISKTFTKKTALEKGAVKGDPGQRGYSAYEIAQQNGFTGTIKEWLESLEGKEGKPGNDGDKGKNAFELAVECGFNGTLQEWIKSLEGIEGPSAYDLALENGFEGTVEEWLKSLKKEGEPGKQGDPGKDGRGIPLDGKAGQILSKKSDDDYDTEWIDKPQGGDFTPNEDQLAAINSGITSSIVEKLNNCTSGIVKKVITANEWNEMVNDPSLADENTLYIVINSVDAKIPETVFHVKLIDDNGDES